LRQLKSRFRGIELKDLGHETLSDYFLKQVTDWLSADNSGLTNAEVIAIHRNVLDTGYNARASLSSEAQLTGTQGFISELI